MATFLPALRDFSRRIVNPIAQQRTCPRSHVHGSMWSMVIDETTLATIVTRLTAAASPARIILFGSAATGTGTSDSDIDLLVVEDEVDDVRAESVRLRAVLGDLGHPVDVLVIRSDRFDETKDLIGGIAYPANRYGRVLYEAA